MALPLAAILGLLGGAASLGGAMGSFGKRKGGLSEFFMGTPEQDQQFQRFTPEQQDVMGQMRQQGLENTDFSGIENLARKRFSEDTIPSLAERFTAMGSGGGQRSSAFESAIGRADSDLEAQLGGLRSQFGMQQLQMGMQPSFENVHKTPSSGMLQQGISSLLQMLPLLMQLKK